MKNYRYRAKKSPQEVVEAVLQAESEEDVISKVNDMGFVVVHVQEETNSSAALSKVSEAAPSYRGFEGPAVTRLYKQMGRMLKSGIPLFQALTLAEEQLESAKLRDILAEVKKNVGEGHPFSQALTQYPEYFSPFDLAMIEAGEMVGHLDDSLNRIASYRENQEKILSQIRSSMAYPIFVLIVGFAAIVFMLSYVLPKFASFFLNLGQELPFLTRALISTSQVTQKIWPGILAAAFFFYWMIRRSLKADGKQFGWHRFYLGLPKIGRLITYSQFARFARTLGLLIQSGIPLLRALQTSLPVVSNQVIRAELQTCYSDLTQGGSLGESLRRSNRVPPFVTNLIRAGEESGRLQEALTDIADWYEQELNENMEVLTRLLEPVLILLVGAILGVMIIAVLLPVFSMNAAIS